MEKAHIEVLKSSMKVMWVALCSFPAFFGEDWARERCGDAHLGAYETCVVKQYQPKITGTNACEEGV
jgi:hypothetical protein